MSTDSHPYRLPTTVRPEAYHLELEPDLHAATFSGRVVIDLLVMEPTNEVVLNAAELVIGEVMVDQAGTSQAPFAVDLVVDEDQLHLTLADPLATGPATLTIGFDGVLNDKLRGFYRSVYTDDAGAEHVIATTQMESTDARRAFPCWDEPDFKASFEVTLVVDDNLSAFSNSAEVSTEAVAGGKKRVRFAPTMVMSTYLVAFVVGELEVTDPIDVDGVPLRVIHTPGQGHLTAFALEAGAHALRFFTEYFSIPYPGDKLDMAAIPDFAAGAMENVGLVTYRVDMLLVDPASAAQTELMYIADVVCHEIAHMWFGDLVTMKWWDGIWLNEAFATFMAAVATDAFRPEWMRWVTFGIERDAALQVDGLHSTRPVEYPVGRPEEAEGMFDLLTYEKGGSVLRMLEQFIGPEVFRAGIHDYLVTHSYSNTVTTDLWDALERSSGRDVRSIMGTWIDQGGYPLLSVADDGSVTQEPFTYRDTVGGAIGSNWLVPVQTRNLGDPTWVPGLLRGDGLVHGDTVVAGTPGALVNAGGVGYYRVRYPSATTANFASHLGELVPLERFTLVSDAWATLLSGRSSLTDFVTLARALRDSHEGDPSVWAIVLHALGMFNRIIPEADRDVLATATQDLLNPVFDQVGWDAGPHDSERTPTLRGELVAMLGTIGADPEVRAEAARRFAARLETPIPANVESAVLAVVALDGGDETYEEFLDAHLAPMNPQAEERYLMALAHFTDPALVERTYRYAIDEVRTQDAPFLIRRMVAQRLTGPATWERVEANWDSLVERFPVSTMPRLVSGIREMCGDPAQAERVIAFIEANPLPSAGRTVDQTVEMLRVNVSFAQREAASLAGVLRDALL